MNGDLVRRATGNQPGSMLDRVATDPKLDNAEKIRYLYLAALVAHADAAGAEHQQRAAGGPQRQRRRGAAGYLVGGVEYERVYIDSLREAVSYQLLAVSQKANLDRLSG